MTDSKNYDYQVIEDCIGMMQREVSSIQDRADELASRSKNLLAGFTGSMATEYQAAVQRLDLLLKDSGESLQATGKALESGSENMQHIDQAAGKSIPHI